MCCVFWPQFRLLGPEPKTKVKGGSRSSDLILSGRRGAAAIPPKGAHGRHSPGLRGSRPCGASLRGGPGASPVRNAFLGVPASRKELRQGGLSACLSACLFVILSVCLPFSFTCVCLSLVLSCFFVYVTACLYAVDAHPPPPPRASLSHSLCV